MSSSDGSPAMEARVAYQHLVENIPNGVLVLFDSDLRYLEVGPEVLPFSGRNAADMMGTTIHELFPPDAVATLEPELEATLQGESRSFDMEYDEEIHHIETRPTTIEGDQFGVLLTQAVTEERATAAELKRTNERLDQFASMVSHDLQNSLHVAQGRLELYRETGDDTHLENVAAALERMEELTTDLTALARHGDIDEEDEPFSLATVAEEAWAMVNTRSATLTVEDACITGNKGQIQTLLENLFRNAIGHGGSDVTVRGGPLGDGFFVEDTGSGIPAADRPRVFDHGFTTGYSGSGVGLAIVKQIADAHGFKVSIGESDEGGARFEFQ